MTLPSFFIAPLRVGARFCTGLTFLLLVASACGTSDSEVATDSAAPTANSSSDAAVAECTTEGQTRVCQCAGNAGNGRKTCNKGKYGACTSCANDNIKSDAAVLSSQDLCKAGYYEGAFTGDYRPGAFGLGLAESQFEVMIEGAPYMGQPPLAMTLSEADNGPAGEFHTYTVNGGCMTGVAHAVGTDNPFVARLEGNLDCSTGSFVGTLTGRYALLDVMGLEFEFKGPLTAQFALPGSLKDGEWNVAEPAAALGGAQGGGDGGWSADWKADMAPHVDVDPCADLPLYDGGVAAASDAGAPGGGTTSPTKDAATPADAGG